MIPDESTPIKNMILIEIIAQGRLTYDEVRIASFIMRWSWGFEDKANNRRQDWTKDFSVSEIAKEIKIHRGTCSETISKMVNEGKLLRYGNKFQFNEHYESWNVSEKATRLSEKPTRQHLSEIPTQLSEIPTPLSEKPTPSVGNTDTPDIPQTIMKKDSEGENALHKETIKETKDKETIKKRASAQNQKIQIKDEKQEKAKELIREFCTLRGIPLDSGFFSKNIRSARALAASYPVPFVLAGVSWRLANDPDGFWKEKLFSLNTVYSHFAEWIAQSSLKTEKTFNDWLSRNKEQDYRVLNEPDAKIKAFFVAFNRALKEGINPTEEEWSKYQQARELAKESIRR